MCSQYIVLAYIVNLTVVSLKMKPTSCAIFRPKLYAQNSYGVQIEQYGNNYSPNLQGMHPILLTYVNCSFINWA
jgi:hypothetical protein